MTPYKSLDLHVSVPADLLGELNEARERVPPERWREFENFFIGALSNHCEPSVWRDALKLAKESFPNPAVQK